MSSCLGTDWPATPASVRNIDVTARDRKDNTPLHLAIRPYRYNFRGTVGLEVIVALLHAGADVNASNEDGNTPLHLAAKWTLPNSKVIVALLQVGADVNASNEDSNTPLHLAIISQWSKKEGNPAPVVALLQAGADVNATNERGNTPLHEAIKEGPRSFEIAMKLIEWGADINARNDDGNRPLHIAAEAEYFEIFAALLDVGADVSARNKLGNTPLHSVAHNHDGPLVETVSALIRAGADVNASNLYGHTPLHLAVGRGTIKLILSTFSSKALEFEMLAMKLLLANPQGKSDVTFLVHSEAAALSAAADSAAMEFLNSEMIEILIEAGADVNARTESGYTPLHGIANIDVSRESTLRTLFTNKILEVIAILLEAGADINARDNDGITPLHNSLDSRLSGRIARGSEAITIFLIEQGANVNTLDADGVSPLDYAVRHGHTKALIKLREVGAISGAENKNADQPID